MEIKSNPFRAKIVHDGCIIVDVKTKHEDSRSPLTPNDARKIAERILKTIPHLHIREKPTWLTVAMNDEDLIHFYWSDKDTWKYGITTMEKAKELANEFIRLYTLDELPEPKVKAMKLTTTPTGCKVKIDGETVAKFQSKISAREYYKDYFDMGEIDSNGLNSHSPKWDRSIRKDHLEHGEMVKYILLLVDYMNEHWGDCE